MYPSGKENVLVTEDQKVTKAISKLGFIGRSNFEAWIASLIPNLFHLSSLVWANLATQADQLSDALYQVTKAVKLSHSPISFVFFGKEKQNESEKGRLGQDPQGKPKG
jgi:hypothetical protein